MTIKNKTMTFASILTLQAAAFCFATNAFSCSRVTMIENINGVTHEEADYIVCGSAHHTIVDPKKMQNRLARAKALGEFFPDYLKKRTAEKKDKQTTLQELYDAAGSQEKKDKLEKIAHTLFKLSVVNVAQQLALQQAEARRVAAGEARVFATDAGGDMLEAYEAIAAASDSGISPTIDLVREYNTGSGPIRALILANETRNETNIILYNLGLERTPDHCAACREWFRETSSPTAQNIQEWLAVPDDENQKTNRTLLTREVEQDEINRALLRIAPYCLFCPDSREAYVAWTAAGISPKGSEIMLWNSLAWEDDPTIARTALIEERVQEEERLREEERLQEEERED